MYSLRSNSVQEGGIKVEVVTRNVQYQYNGEYESEVRVAG
jgi:hypothetical protein